MTLTKQNLTVLELLPYTNYVGKSKLTSILSLSLLFFFVATIALAVKPSLTRAEDATNTPKLTPAAGKKALRASEAAQKKEEIRSQAQVKSCKARETIIKNKSQQVVKFSANMITKFDNISSRTQGFYVNKVVVSGKTVADYDVLVASIATKKAAAQVAVKTAEATATSFNCDSDPKSQITGFREEVKTVISTLKEYRTSVRNLIVAVHTVLGEGEENASTKSAVKKTKLKVTPTITATPTPIQSGPAATTSGGVN